jgi:peptidoglycan DL-endopeptidase LytE
MFKIISRGVMRKTIVASALLFFLFIVTPYISIAAQTVHKVKPGDNLHSIAKKYHVPVNQLQSQNNLKSIKLSLGQTLIIKDAGGNTAGNRPQKTQKTNIAKKKQVQEIEASVGENENDGEFIEYKVKKGDTIDKIASFFNVDREELIESNNLQGLKNKRLSPGRTVLVPKIIDEGEEEIVNLTNKPIKPWKNSDEKYMLVKVAKSFMGAPYKYGGTTVKGLDCSAYVKKIYEIFDVQLPRSAREQFQIGSKIKREELAVGDLVFFRTKRYVKYPTHVGIYIGDGSFIHSSSGHGRIGVKIDALSSDYYANAYTGATRIKDGFFEEKSETTSTPIKTANNM